MPYISASEVGGPSKKTVSRRKKCDGVSEWPTSRNIDINGNYPITTTDDGVAVMIIATAIRTTTHADNPARIRHLIVNLSKSRSHFICQSSRHDHDIGLAWRSSEDNTEAILVISGCRQMHHLNGTAGESKGHWPQRALACPVRNLVKSGP